MNERQKHVKKAIEYLTEYMVTYDKQTGYLGYTDEIIIDDVIYGLGLAIGGSEYKYANGFAKFKARLAEHISKDAHKKVCAHCRNNYMKALAALKLMYKYDCASRVRERCTKDHNDPMRKLIAELVEVI